MNYCTHFDSKYIRQGLALHKSMEEHCKPYHLWILALDEDIWKTLTSRILPNVTVVKLESIETARVKAARSDRTWKEYIWTLTSAWMLHMIRRVGAISYVDADCFFFSDPGPLYEEIGNRAVAITPHRFPPDYAAWLMNGIYNVGIVYATENGLPCIAEWTNLCLEWCKAISDGERFADQKYWDYLVPRHRVHPIQHLGVNLAPWNAKQYHYGIRDKRVFVNDHPLILYHFHQGFDPRWPIPKKLRDEIYPKYKEAWNS